jgi:hypothetical protein
MSHQFEFGLQCMVSLDKKEPLMVEPLRVFVSTLFNLTVINRSKAVLSEETELKISYTVCAEILWRMCLVALLFFLSADSLVS